jgi:hypothetical protein
LGWFKRGKVLENKKERGEDETRSFRKKQEELEILAVENHIFCFEITHILSVVLGFFSTKHGIML